MTPAIVLLGEIAISLLVSLLSSRMIRQPLYHVLQDICPTERQAAFWVTYTRAILFLAPLLCVLLVDLSSDGHDALFSLRATLLAAITGTLIALLFLGRQVILPAKRELSKQD